MNFHPGSITWGRSADGRLVPVHVNLTHRPKGKAPCTPEQREAVIAAFEAGKSYSQISRDLEISRNSIAGILHRAREAGKIQREKDLRQIRTVRLPLAPKVAPKKIEPDQPYAPNSVGFFDLEAGHCRWPLWKDEVAFSEKLFCGNAVEDGKPYCAHCNGLSVAPRRTDSFDKKHGFFKFTKMGRRR